MIRISDVSLQFGPQQILTNASLSITPGHRLGLVGPNGSGKTTLLRCIYGSVEPDKGRIIRPSDFKIAFLPQEIKYISSGKPLLQHVLEVFSHIFEIEDRMRELEHYISENPTHDHLEKYDECQLTFTQADGYKIEANTREVLTGLGFSITDFNKPVNEFSGGWQMRIALAKMLLSNPDCMLLDEPTNHLDIETLVWLENYLKKFPGMLVLVSHDKYFLDNLVTHIAELDQTDIISYKGNYSDYEIQKEQRSEQLLAQAKNQQAKIAHLEQFIERFRYKATKAKQVQSRIKQLEKMKIISTAADSTAAVRFDFPAPRRSGDPVYLADNISFSYDSSKKLIYNSDLEIRRGDKMALVGPNGIGKSTLLKLINGTLVPQNGTSRSGYHVKTGYFSQHHLDQLTLKNTVLQEVWSCKQSLPESSIRSLLGRFLFSGENADKPVSVLSGGEKSRIVLMKLLLSEANFLILDEPTNHLDIQSKEVLANALQSFQGTVLIVSHDRFFLDMLVRKVIYFKNYEIREFLGNYSEYYSFLQSLESDAIPKENSKSLKKEKKRKEAEERQRKYREEKHLKKEFQSVEQRIKSIESRCRQIQALYASDDYLSMSPVKMADISREEKKLTNELNEKEIRWLELHELLDQ